MQKPKFVEIFGTPMFGQDILGCTSCLLFIEFTTTDGVQIIHLVNIPEELTINRSDLNLCTHYFNGTLYSVRTKV